jgi:hypothetical protein
MAQISHTYIYSISIGDTPQALTPNLSRKVEYSCLEFMAKSNAIIKRTRSGLPRISLRNSLNSNSGHSLYNLLLCTYLELVMGHKNKVYLHICFKVEVHQYIYIYNIEDTQLDKYK